MEEEILVLGVYKVNGLLENVKEVNCLFRNGYVENGENLSEKIVVLKVESNGFSIVFEEEKKEKVKDEVLGKFSLFRNK